MLADKIDSWAQEWEQKGEARILRRLLERRFLRLPERAESRLTQATEEDLLRWSDAILDAPTLEQFFVR